MVVAAATHAVLVPDLVFCSEGDVVQVLRGDLVHGAHHVSPPLVASAHPPFLGDLHTVLIDLKQTPLRSHFTPYIHRPSEGRLYPKGLAAP